MILRFTRFPVERIIIALALCAGGCATHRVSSVLRSGESTPWDQPPSPYVTVLGIAQDGGWPHAGCERDCCRGLWESNARGALVCCLAIVDPISQQRWLLDATPDLPQQLHNLIELTGWEQPRLDGVLLTHAHIGHYTGLMHLGREVMGTSGVPVYAMPRMRDYLRTSGPWSQLVSLGNIDLRAIEHAQPLMLNERITVTPMLVPHRDEYSETVGFHIDGPQRSVLFIPDIDKWTKWDRVLEDELARVDVAYIDGSFYADGELPNRSMAEIPHPFISETMDRLAELDAHERGKVRFIHLNHTNPALPTGGAAQREIQSRGFAVARQGDVEVLDAGQ